MSKSKGSRTERELVHLFFEADWQPVRIAGSGSTPLPSPDLLVGSKGRVLAIECKSGKTIKYIQEDQIDELIDFSSRFGSEAWVGLRFDRKDWLFLKPDQLSRTKSGVYAASFNHAKENGLSFDDLIKG